MQREAVMPTLDRERFLELVRDALAHLYDFAYLRTHPLLDVLAPDSGQSTMDRVLRLRQHLQQSIERLAPTTQIPETAKEWRPYLALRYHYVDCLELAQVEQRLGLGDRQLLRERNRGLDALAALLWEDQMSAAGAQGVERRPESAAPDSQLVSNELSALGVEYSQTSICDVLDKALQSAGGLLAQHGVVIDCAPIDARLVVLADATLLRQTLIACLSHAISLCSTGSINVRALLVGVDVSIAIGWVGGDEQSASLAAIEALVEAQKGHVLVETDAENVTLTITIPQARTVSVLLIEDNTSLLQLYGRYLALEQYRVLAAETGKDGLELARRERPDVIVLDIMMRGMDGLEVLQRLRSQPETQKTAVIISSVLPERELALSLGADAFLAKPVSRVGLMDAIQSCLDLPRSAEPQHPVKP
jgi:CheY-like chemotaxis protein